MPVENILLKRILKKYNTPHLSEMDRIVVFFKAILELERSKEPDISNYFPYEIHTKDNDNSIILIDLPCNTNFTKDFLDNRNLTFPKDLYVGLPITRKDKSGQVIAFSLIVDYDDLKGYDPYENLLPIRISNFTLDSRHIEELELTEEEIDEIDEALKKVKNFDDLQNLVKNQIGENFDLNLELQLGLSSKNIALAQISTELNHLNSNLIDRNDLLKHFLTHYEFDNQLENVSVDELLPVSLLDESQASAIAHALSNRFTVITGAPGTGKTQVILNIIANALLKDKTVLVASKNNKAVDNVKERFDVIDPSHYLLRFGKKEYVRSQTIPALTQILTRLEGLKNQPDNLPTFLPQYRNLTTTIKDAKKELSRIEELKVLIPKLLSEQSDIESQLVQEDQFYLSNCEKILNRFSDVSHLENISAESVDYVMSQISRLNNSLQRKYSGVLKIWYNIFSRKKHAETILGYIENLPYTIKSDLRGKNLICCSIDNFKDGDAIISYATQIISILSRIVDFKRCSEKEQKRHNDRVYSLNTKHNQLKRDYDSLSTEMESLTKRKGDLLNTIKWSKKCLINLGPQLVTAKISEIERSRNASHKISQYKSYLPDNIPWKNNEIPGFISKSRDFLSVCRLISITSLSVKAGFPLTDNLFDILIIDEASQCDVASALPLILRAKQVVVIGDPMQLKHITSVNVNEENVIREALKLSSKPFLKYTEQSLWDYAADFLAHANQNSSPITLKNHYRCHHDIIGYSNNQFYGRFLDNPLNVMTDESNMTLPQQGIWMINVHGKQESDNVNINKIEADRVASLAKEICTLKADVTIGIVTPFRDQADYVKSRLDDFIKGNVEVNTAHGFQGDEKDVIIYSLVVTDNSPERKVKWIDYMNPNLVNVAVTRARQTLYIVGNADYIKSVSPEQNALGYLIRYAQSKVK